MKAPSSPRGRNLFPEELKLWQGSFGMVSAGVMAAIGGRTESMYVSVIMSEMMWRKERGGWNNRLASLQRAGSQQEGMLNCMIAFKV